MWLFRGDRGRKHLSQQALRVASWKGCCAAVDACGGCIFREFSFYFLFWLCSGTCLVFYESSLTKTWLFTSCVAQPFPCSVFHLGTILSLCYCGEQISRSPCVVFFLLPLLKHIKCLSNIVLKIQDAKSFWLPELRETCFHGNDELSQKSVPRAWTKVEGSCFGWGLWDRTRGRAGS